MHADSEACKVMFRHDDVRLDRPAGDEEKPVTIQESFETSVFVLRRRIETYGDVLNTMEALRESL